MNHIFWFEIEIKLKSQMVVCLDELISGGKLITGAILEYGVTAKSEDEALTNISDDIRSNVSFSGLEYEIVPEYVAEIDRKDVNVEIYADPDIKDSLLGDPYNIGVWYKTGVGWYFDDEE